MKKITFKKIVFALAGIILIGIGVAFNANALLGNDPIGILYDGVRNVLGFSYEQLGLVTNLVNVSVLILLLFIGRKYLNIGTVIYMLPLGYCVSIGHHLYSVLFPHQTLFIRIIAALSACFLVYIGVAIFIAVEIGLDPYTALVMVIAEKLNWSFKKTKIIFDICCVGISTVLGGVLGVITIFTALTAGPAIQYLSERFKKSFSS